MANSKFRSKNKAKTAPPSSNSKAYPLFSKPALPGKNSIWNLQQQYGNHYVQRVLQSEQEPGPSNSESLNNIKGNIQRANGSGQTLNPPFRAQMEPTFGPSFDKVRVHTDSQADSLNRSLKSKAFTTGQDIFFRKGEYNPHSTSGKELIVHKLTHVVQQGGTQIQPKLAVSQPGDKYEQEADEVARAVVQKKGISQDFGLNEQIVRRQAEEEEEDNQLVQTKTNDDLLQRPLDEEKEGM